MDQEIAELYKQGLGSTAISNKLGCSFSHVLNLLRKNNVPIRKLNTVSVDKVMRLYSQGFGSPAIAEKLDCSSTHVLNILKKNGIPTRKFNDANIDEIICLYQNGDGLKKIAKMYGCSYGTIKGRLIKAGIAIRGPIRYGQDLEDRIINLYKLHKSVIIVAELLDIHFQKVYYILKKHNQIIEDTPLEIDEIIRLLYEGKTVKDICGIFDKKDWQIRHFLKTNNVKTAKDWALYTKHIIDMYNNKETMIEIARKIGCSDVTVARILHNNNIDIRPYVGSNTVVWKEDRTIDSNSFHCCYRYKKWVINCKNQCSYIGGLNDKNQCHHIYGMRFILKSSLIKHFCLPEDFKRIAVFNDSRFYDVDNGLIVTKDEHLKIESISRSAHYYWRIWRHYPDFALSHFPFLIKQYDLFDDKGMIDPQNSDIISVNSKFPELKKIIRYEHYIGTIPAHKFILVGHKHNIITGIAIFGRGGNKNLPQNCWELIRLCVPYYVIRPYTIDFLNKCIHYIKNNYVNINKIIAYSDPNVGHDGAIYRMAGWKKEGKIKPSYCYFDPNTNQLKHKSYCRRVKGIDKTEKQLATERGLIRVELSPLKKYSCITSN
jgi:intein-encoded DNA endonuclease-like protein